MKKIILILVVLALAVPTAALAATEFSLGGFIKMDTMWDSSTANKNLVSKMYRDNDPINQHGRLRATANGSRFSFTISGPKLWGAQVTGYLEADWDSVGATTPPTGIEAQDTGNFRIRHAMFRLNWPETQLLFGQYWSFFSEFFPEVAQDGGYHYRGANVYRPAQISITQKFAGAWTVGFMAATPRVGSSLELGVGPGATMSQDERSESPHLEAKLGYEQDLWGKAAYYGKPRGFTAQVASAWQRTNIASNAAFATSTWGQNCYTAVAGGVTAPDHRYVNHWAVQGSMFIPLIPTTSANLAGTASILTQWSVGEGQGFVLGTWLTDDAFYQAQKLNAAGTAALTYEKILTSSFTGFVQGQYYFNNEWFLTGVWGYMRNFGLGFDRLTPGGNFRVAMASNPLTAANNAGSGDMTKYSNQLTGTLWYQPIKAIKFGLSYAYTRDVYFQKTGYAAAGTFTGAAAASSQFKDIGEDHRMEFVGFFFF